MTNITTSLSFLANIPLYQNEKPYKIVPGAKSGPLPPSLKLHNIQEEIHNNINIVDIRPNKRDFSLGENGFECLSHTAHHLNFDTVQGIKAYKKEVSQSLEKHFDADRVITWDFRRRIHATFDKGEEWDYNDPRETEGPAVMAHCDHTFDSGLTMINATLSADEKHTYLNGKYRLRMINTWRPLLDIVEDQPLAVCDFQTVQSEDLVAIDNIVLDKLGESYLLKYREDQQWYWIHHQTPSEPWLILTWDSDSNGQARYCPHTSFINQEERQGAPPRESVETRSIVITRRDAD